MAVLIHSNLILLVVQLALLCQGGQFTRQIIQKKTQTLKHPGFFSVFTEICVATSGGEESTEGICCIGDRSKCRLGFEEGLPLSSEPGVGFPHDHGWA